MTKCEPVYNLEMNSSQARTCLKAVELLMRLKLNQPKEIPFALIAGEEDFCERRDKAVPHLEEAFAAMYEGRGPSDLDWKDAEWYRLYNIYQVLRHAIHDAEHPETDGVDAYPPMQMTQDEPLPDIKWRIIKT